MIKFWKSAAKGKSGCPVRPPEVENQNNPRFKLISIDLNSEDGDFNIFEKKSQLSLTLKDILNEKICIKHFVSYMESIEKNLLINCWLELDNYRLQLLVNTPNEYNGNCHNKINNSKSFDDNSINLSCDPGYSLMAQRNSWKASCSSLNSSSKVQLKSDFLKNKPINLTDQAINLFKKYVALEAPNKLNLTDEIRKIVISNICHPEGKIREDCFKPVQESLMCEMETYFSDFQNSPQYIKMQIDILTSGNIDLKDILYNETILFYFTEYLEQESCSVLLEFLIAVSHFRDNLINCKNLSIDQIQSDAIILYEKYFSLQATSPIGFSTEIRLKVESDICCETGPAVTCFDIPYRIVFKTLSNYVRIFLESEIYYNYLSEMIKSVDQMYPNCKSHSDCSSEYSLSTQNTLLAMGDLYMKKKRNHSVPDMTIDSNQLYNADALWQRKKHDGLTLGRINSLGRFESKFEPDPDKMHKSVLRKMVNKFVPATSSNVKEEMAWQIAHMIVKDVTDLTMAPPDNDHE